jgi:hypothetical protein
MHRLPVLNETVGRTSSGGQMYRTRFMT